MAMTVAMRRHLSLPCHLAAALLLAFLHVPPASAQPLPWQLCNDTAGNYTNGGAYQANIRALAGALARNASSSPALFAKGAVGAAPDAAVYALVLCRGDTNASACAACAAANFQNAQQLCALRRGATMFDDPCILRYADWDFLANATDDRGRILARNYNNVPGGAASAFYAAAAGLVNATADHAAADALRRFGTGEVGFDEASYPRIYSLAQCTPDMAAADCRISLREIITRFMPENFFGKPGGRVFGVRCNYRFETYQFFSGRPLLQLPGPPGPPPAPSPASVGPPGTGEGRTRHRTGLELAITLPIAAAALLLIVACVCLWGRRRPAERKKASDPSDSANSDDIESIDSLLLDIATLRAATDNFSEINKLGEGGFGAVYKGVLPEGQEIAVKRLSQSSRQGIEELKTELVLVAKLQHKNLVRLIGVCVKEHEKLLVYEYMANKSLDTVLFDADKSKDLDWAKRLKIVNAVAHGLQYLHEDSRLRIIHRDLKASNVLLDLDYNPKISDFGLAKLFGRDQSQDVTSRIAGTYGYMAPEYAMRGLFSAKSDAFSFGVLILEIVTGRKNSSMVGSEQSVDLLSLVWEHWAMGTIEELVDPSLRLRGRPAAGEVLKLVNVGLLCVQDRPADRPAMSAVIVMLGSSSVSLQAPSRPTFCVLDHEEATGGGGGDSKTKAASPNEVSLTELEPR